MLYCYIIKNQFYECIVKYPSLLEVFYHTSDMQRAEIFKNINELEIQYKGKNFFQSDIYITDHSIWFKDTYLQTLYQIEFYENLIMIDNRLNPFYDFLKRIYPTCVFVEEKYM